MVGIGKRNGTGMSIRQKSDGICPLAIGTRVKRNIAEGIHEVEVEKERGKIVVDRTHQQVIH